ncbi:3-dehydro-L-gulonate 2-dehydrogenase [Hufsiella ginkgonis]|uniref:3-dehydro-L-gulonate 2-dehydrogenase n=1 Tax=Hufsiella ginkgonis TaxID=2695274 RepID=A0A7K1XS11_9SPHI|nr:3-dehydro-L-gulonate 2-dehydrogenase [Hufsiella ginkgonis]MXV13724.1 3-dehydro-L-gulonate 2-dehydrogenase [Hufsiella ginkgonis]
MRIAFEELRAGFLRVLTKVGFTAEKAERCARIFAGNSRDGIYSHGLNRFPGFIDYIEKGLVDIHADPFCFEAHGAIECWDGRSGPGVLNAETCMNRAIELAKIHGISCVALRNTNHWMRGGTYGLQAADAGCISICFTNTMANMPPWGGTLPRLGNNPMVISAPYPNGHVLLDMAMSQYSYGKMGMYKAAGEMLPYDGGFDTAGNLTKDPAAILESWRPLPIGLWKGAGLALVLDLLASILSKGQSTGQITEAKYETGCSQVFICIYREEETERLSLMNSIIGYTQTGAGGTGKPITYPGENMLKTREQNMAEGIPVNEDAWKKVQNL